MFKDKNRKHLKPLSKYAHRVLSDPVARTSIHHFIKPPSHFKNDTTKTTTIDFGQITAASCPQTLCFPDVRCFVKSPLLRRNPVACEGRPSVGSVTDDVHAPHGSKCEAQNVCPSFDLDVDDLLNLSPCGDGSQRVLDCEKKRKLGIGSTSLHQRKYGHCLAAPVDDKGLNVTTVNQDGVYGSYHTEEQTKPRNVSVAANQQPPRASWSQLHLDCRDVNEECLSESFQIARTEFRQHSSVLDKNISMSGGSSSELARSPSRGSVDDLWRVGLPMLREVTAESPLNVKVSKPQKDGQLCAFRSTCSQTTCSFL